VLLVTRAVAATMSDLVPVQPGVVAAVAVVLALVTLLASWLPARRAAGVDPAEALRTD
jgi:ABC-type lipoprotein release transport system permease subunit